METKKISFGFSKISKKREILSTSRPENRVELIDCLEGKSIKIKDVVEEIKGPLIIPIKDTSKNLLDRVKEARNKHIKEEIKNEDVVLDSSLSIDELAARELIREAKNRDSIKNETKVFALPLNEDKFVAEGEEEPSLDDYESVPISDYGMAMLRGMGWKEGMPIGKTHSKTVAPIIPELRPKGLGLGANKMVNSNKPSQAFDKDGKELQLVKGAFGKIIAGNHRGHYCEVQGLDDENCRIIVKTAITNEVLNLSEFLFVPVTKEEFALGSRIINNAKYEEYKSDKKDEQEKSGENSKEYKKSKTMSHEKHIKKKSSKRDSVSESDEYESDHHTHKSHKKSKKKSKSRCKSSRQPEYDQNRKTKKKSHLRHKSSDSDSDYRKRTERREKR